MTKRDNDKLNNLYMEAVQPQLKAQSGTVYAIIYEVPYEGQRLLGIYSTSEAAQQALGEFGAEDDYDRRSDDDYSIKELALNQKADWNYSVQ